MKLSIVIPVLDSVEVLRRQLIYLERMAVDYPYEIIIVDDGSIPALNPDFGNLNGKVIYTKDYRPWTWALARNAGAREAKGKYLLMFDVDHFVSRETFDMIRDFDGYKIQFLREFGVLDENGEFKQDLKTLVSYGFPEERYKNRGFRLSPLPNNFVMRRDVFWDIGGYREDLVERSYPQGEDRLFKKAWHEWMRRTGGNVHTERPTIYMFPNGYLCGDVDFDKNGLFHKLSRKTRRNSKYHA